jgi:formate dehydrogenase subunit gamma
MGQRKSQIDRPWLAPILRPLGRIFPMTPDDTRIREIASAHLGKEGPLLPILHDIQAAFGHVPPQTASVLADVLNLGRAEVHGVITFYHDFRASPAGRHIIKLCRAEACQAMGANALARTLQHELGIGWGETTPDGAVTLEAVFCLGLCACAPTAMIDGQLRGRATAEVLLDDLKVGA